jgi:hypothetical protein
MNRNELPQMSDVRQNTSQARRVTGRPYPEARAAIRG